MVLLSNSQHSIVELRLVLISAVLTQSKLSIMVCEGDRTDRDDSAVNEHPVAPLYAGKSSFRSRLRHVTRRDIHFETLLKIFWDNGLSS